MAGTSFVDICPDASKFDLIVQNLTRLNYEPCEVISDKVIKKGFATKNLTRDIRTIEQMLYECKDNKIDENNLNL